MRLSCTFLPKLKGRIIRRENTPSIQSASQILVKVEALFMAQGEGKVISCKDGFIYERGYVLSPYHPSPIAVFDPVCIKIMKNDDSIILEYKLGLYEFSLPLIFVSSTFVVFSFLHRDIIGIFICLIFICVFVLGGLIRLVKFRRWLRQATGM